MDRIAEKSKYHSFNHCILSNFQKRKNFLFFCCVLLCSLLFSSFVCVCVLCLVLRWSTVRFSSRMVMIQRVCLCVRCCLSCRCISLCNSAIVLRYSVSKSLQFLTFYTLRCNRSLLYFACTADKYMG